MIHPIPPGLFCVPSAICAITGAEPTSVIVPAINRHSGYKLGLHDTPAGVQPSVMVKVLEELRCKVRPYKDNAAAGPLKAHLQTWAKRSLDRWPGRIILVCTRRHALVIENGMVYDSWEPAGCPGSNHPFSKTPVVWAALVEPPV